MKNIGWYLIIFGVGSIVLNYFGYEFKILMWMGEGYLLRGAIAIIGLLLVIFSGGNETQTDTDG